MTHYRVQIVTISDDGSALVQAWGIPAGEADRLRSILPEPDIEVYAPADAVDAIIEAGEGGVVISD